MNKLLEKVDQDIKGDFILTNRTKNFKIFGVLL